MLRREKGEGENRTISLLEDKKTRKWAPTSLSNKTSRPLQQKYQRNELSFPILPSPPTILSSHGPAFVGPHIPWGGYFMKKQESDAIFHIANWKVQLQQLYSLYLSSMTFKKKKRLKIFFFFLNGNKIKEIKWRNDLRKLEDKVRKLMICNSWQLIQHMGGSIKGFKPNLIQKTQ